MSGTVRFLLAIGVTLMEVLVAAHCGPPLRNAWTAEIGHPVSAGGLAFTLMEIWPKTIVRLPEQRATLLVASEALAVSASQR